VTDLGIAGAVTPGTPLVPGDAGNPAAPSPSALFGTPTHMAPEQFADPASGDERSDVYAFGVVLYQMAAGGALPFQPRVAPGPGASARLFAELQRMHEQAPVPAVESPLFPIAERCLEKNPEARYPSFRALRE